MDVELPRLRLLERLDGRWEHTVTLITAGAGFGKTTMLAQAVRAHQLEPRGVDAWVSCDAGHEDAARLASSMLQAISPGRPPAGGGRADVCRLARQVVDALVGHAPFEVCLLVDDVHELPMGSTGAALLAAVLAQLPTTAHLVLSGRSIPDLPLARREAAGDVLRVSGDDLMFTDVEVAALARRLGRDPAIADTLHGWPALVRLSFAAGPSTPVQYAREEILSRLPHPALLALAALAALGTATAGEVARVTGGPVSLDDLARRIPLLAVLDGGRHRAHDLWSDAVARSLSPQQRQRIRHRAAETLCSRGDVARAGALALAAQDWSLLAGLAVDLVRSTLSTLPHTVARQWLDAIPDAVTTDPGFVLLRAAVLHAGDFADRSVDGLLDLAWRGMRSRGDNAGAAAVLGQAVITAHSRADVARLTQIAGWTDDLEDAGGPVGALLRHTLAGVRAEIDGDPETALDHFRLAPVRQVHPALAVFTLRFQYHCLNMCGRGAEAAELADRTLGDAADPRVRLSGAMARWLAGDPRQLGRLRELAPEVAGTPQPGAGRQPATTRELFVMTALAGWVASCCGEQALLPARPCGDPALPDNARDAVLAAGAAAAIAVARGDENGAALMFAEQLRRWPMTDRFTERHLRRFLALGYVLDAGLRTCWDSTDLGPSQLLARAAARALLGARSGDLAPAAALNPEHALCFLPLPWSVELMTRLAAAGHSGGSRLRGWFGDAIGPATAREIQLALESADATVARGAALLVAAAPEPPNRSIGIHVLGGLRVTVDGVEIDPPELRRSRVRQLLGALVLHRSLTRERAGELLWPELDPARTAQNMRVTLTHLRRLLDPERVGGDTSHHLRTTGDQIRLVAADRLTVDLWTVDRLDADARRARADGDLDGAAQLLRDAVARWTGSPLPDLADLPDPDIVGRLAAVRAGHHGRLLELGELELVSGSPATAFTLAERALGDEPYDARGHRLALAAALRTRNPVQVTAARRMVCAALRELGVAPDPATAILLRQLSPAPDRRQRREPLQQMTIREPA